VLALVDADGSERWRRTLGPEFAWPDDDFPTPYWLVIGVSAVRLSTDGPEQLIVAAHHPSQYPARVSLLDPLSGECDSTFWHMGHIHGMRVERNLFGDRDGILVWGINNKLDGFAEPPMDVDWVEGDDLPVTDWDMVPVVMVLDPHPEKLAGLGPPRTKRLGPDVKPASPHAYAFINAGHTRARRSSVAPAPWLAKLVRADCEYFGAPRADRVWRIDLLREAADALVDRPAVQVGGGIYIVNGELRVLNVQTASPETVQTSGQEPMDKAEYEALWRRLIIDGEYQDLPPVWRPDMPAREGDADP
jgi:hypothetical protein